MSSASKNLPSKELLEKAFELSISIGKPIESYFWEDSCNDKIRLCVNEDKDRIIYKNNEEHTSLISNIYQPFNNDYIVITDNTIYIISGKTKAAKMPEDL